jgi:glucosamine--fructose-6-phosphate aminotransferase (isomerizing)
MCGIVGYVGDRDAAPVLVECLRRMEYRGYDSAGVAVVGDGRLEVRRSAGKIANLERLLGEQPVHGSVGVAHTRWATHGRPSDRNAHPHSDCSRSVAVVHNGIIENHRPLRSELEQGGHRFGSETDTEVVPHLIEAGSASDLAEAAGRAAGQLQGAYALGIVSREAPGTLVGVRNGGPPLIVGLSEAGHFLASDVAAVLPHTRDVLFLEDGEMAILSREGCRLTSLDGSPVRRAMTRVPWDAEAAEKGGYAHFMLKEIHEQPQALIETCRGRIDLEAGDAVLPELQLDAEAAARIRRVVIVACGTSFHAGLVGRHFIEELARIPVQVELASEFRYRTPLLDETTLTLAVTQSGETADTLGALRAARSQGSRAIGICNVVGSSVSRDADGVVYTRAGLEIGVASTKAFTTQLAALYLLAVRLGRLRGALPADAARERLRDLLELPLLAETVLGREHELVPVAERLANARSALYLGRGVHHALALEGALKLKEISYVHAEGYAAGEMKHGPIALIDEAMPVVVVAPRGALHEKTVGNIEEVKARDGVVIAVVSDDDPDASHRANHVIRLPATSELLQSVLVALPLQLLAYHAAVLRHCDVDQPRNLAKSVTVE